MANVATRIVHAWNAFTNQEKPTYRPNMVGSSGSRPQSSRMRITNEKSIVASIYTRMSVDAASARMRHIRIDENERFVEEVNSGLNYCLKTKANIDQSGRALLQDAILTMLDKGYLAVVAVDTTINPMLTGAWDAKSIRVGEIMSWQARTVTVRLYDDTDGQHKDVTLAKEIVAIAHNPFYQTMNEPNSTLQRLIKKLNLLDVVDEENASGKLDIIMQLPYTVRSEARRQEANQRRQDIEYQLKGSKYGIAWADASEKITQLNRPAENNLWSQIEGLLELLYSQLGITKSVMDGTADEATMLNYHNRTIEPLLGSLRDAMVMAFLTKTATTQGQHIDFYRDPFKLVPISQIAEIADKFTRNKIASSNEIRTAIGWKPSDDPTADKLENSNMPEKDQTGAPATQSVDTSKATSEMGSMIDKIFKELGLDEPDDTKSTPQTASKGR